MKKLFTILLLSVCFVSVPSCQKDSNGKGFDPNRLSSNEAKEFFELNSTCLRFLSVGGDKPSGTKSALTGNMVIDWDSALESENSESYFVEVPINMASPISANLYDGIGHMHKNIHSVQVKMSLLIEKHKSDNCIHSTVVTTVGTYSNASVSSRYCFSSDKASFSGYLIFSSEDGTYTGSKIYKNGRFVENTLSTGNQFVKIDSTGKDIPYSGILFMSSRGLLTKGGGDGGGSGEDNTCPFCGGALGLIGDNYICPVCNILFEFIVSSECPYCFRSIPSCECVCPICNYPNRWGKQCMCVNPTGERCQICGLYGCNGQCNGGNGGNGRPESCLITINTNCNGGFVEKSPDLTLYPLDGSVTLTAYPYTGYVFYGWYENGLLISQNYVLNFVVSQDRTLLAVFEEL